MSKNSEVRRRLTGCWRLDEKMWTWLVTKRCDALVSHRAAIAVSGHSPVWTFAPGHLPLPPKTTIADMRPRIGIVLGVIRLQFYGFVVRVRSLAVPALYARRSMKQSCVCPSIPSIDSSSGGFATENRTSRRYRSTAAASCSNGASAANVGSVVLTADERG